VGVVTTREKLADYAHRAWSGWMSYLLLKCEEFDIFDEETGDCRTVTAIPDRLVERWRRQMDTPYTELPADEQASDLKEADTILATIGAVEPVSFRQLREITATLKQAQDAVAWMSRQEDAIEALEERRADTLGEIDALKAERQELQARITAIGNRIARLEVKAKLLEGRRGNLARALAFCQQRVAGLFAFEAETTLTAEAMETDE
jgi:septal ring factor EnvC (AmiA/AmiB activator)